MVQSVIFLCTLDGNNIARVFHHANGGFIPGFIAADGAARCIGYVFAYFAITDFFPCFKNRVCKSLCLFLRHTKDMKSKPLGAFSSYSGQPRKTFGKLRQRKHAVIHIIAPALIRTFREY